MKRILSILLLIVIFTACDSEPEGQGELSQPDTLNSWNEMEQSPGTLKLADFTMKVPDNWIMEKPSSDMRIVQYKVKGTEGLEVVGFYFGDQPDMLEANVTRWRNQFTKVQDSSTTEMDHNIQLVKITGTFKEKPFPMAQEYQEAENYTSLAAIVPSGTGPYFFKMVGPNAKIEQEEKNFKDFLKSYERKQNYEQDFDRPQ